MGDESQTPLVFSGSQTVRNLDETTEKLKEYIQTSDPVVIDCTRIEEVDVGFIQLLLSARRTAAAQGRIMRMTAPAGGALLTCLLNAGLLAENRSGSRDFWMSGGDK